MCMSKALVLAVPLALALPSGMVTDHQRFNQWMLDHGKVYATEQSEASAFAAWIKNDATIGKHNSKGLSFTLAHNEYSDITPDEFFGARLGYAANTTRAAGTMPTQMHVASGGPNPSAVDWVTAGAVTSVKNQGQCGSCWSFSAAGAIEGAYQIASGSLMNLSEEDLVQCDTTDSGCNGGLMDNAFTWVSTHGIASLDAYPYTSSAGTRGSCNTAVESEPSVYVSGYVDVPSEDETSLLSAVAQQPVSIAIEADQSVFQFYSSGVLDSSACGTNLDHGVLLVGYGTDATSGKEYWKVKNSWGTTWGESGYVRLVRGKNMCGVASQASYPTGARSADPSPSPDALVEESLDEK